MAIFTKIIKVALALALVGVMVFLVVTGLPEEVVEAAAAVI